jgi:NADH pyrophosphatase NudC (nudix superfamily)
MERASMNYRFCPNDGRQLIVDSSKHARRPFCQDCDFVHYPNPAPCVAVLIGNRSRPGGVEGGDGLTVEEGGDGVA